MAIFRTIVTIRANIIIMNIIIIMIIIVVIIIIVILTTQEWCVVQAKEGHKGLGHNRNPRDHLVQA